MYSLGYKIANLIMDANCFAGSLMINNIETVFHTTIYYIVLSKNQDININDYYSSWLFYLFFLSWFLF